LKETTKYLVNPGSIGQPRDSDPRAAFLLYDTDENSITFYRVPYDIGRAQEKILSADCRSVWRHGSRRAAKNK